MFSIDFACLCMEKISVSYIGSAWTEGTANAFTDCSFCTSRDHTVKGLFVNYSVCDFGCHNQTKLSGPGQSHTFATNAQA